MRGTVPEAKWALFISNNDNSLFANCGPSSHSALMTPPVNMRTPASLSWLSLRHPPPGPLPLCPVVWDPIHLFCFPAHSLGASQLFGLLSWLFSSLPAPLSLLPPMQLGAWGRD